MIEKALKGNSTYWMWLAFLSAFIAVGGICYVRQYLFGLGLTGMSRDVSWGLYISQFTFLVGVAAGGLMLVLPYYIHNYKAFGKMTILGEFLAIAAIIMCLMFIMADLGQPSARTEYDSASDPEFHALLGYGGFAWLSEPECPLRLGHPHRRTKTGQASEMDLFFCLSFHSVCSLDPYRNRNALLRSARSSFLAVGDYCPTLSCICLCSRSGS